MSRHVVIPDIKMDEEGSYSSEGRSAGGLTSGLYPTASGQAVYPHSFGVPGAAASSVSSSSDVEVISVKRDREREGRCGDCGVQTHEFIMDPRSGQHSKVALSVDGEVHRGRCLFCHPLPQKSLHRPGLSNIVFSSSRSINTVSSHGNNSVQSAGRLLPLRGVFSHGQGAYPDAVESRSIASTVASSIVDEALQGLEEESSDLLDVLTAMRHLPEERQIQARGLEKLWIQSYDEENSLAIGRIGGIPTILSAMTTFPEHATMQQCGCEALQNLADNEYNRDVIVEHGGINAIVTAMNHHVDVPGVQQCGCLALANMASSPQHQLEIANSGGIHAIVNAAQRFRDEESVLRGAYQALRSMGYDPSRHGNADENGSSQGSNEGVQQDRAVQDEVAGQDEQHMENAVVLDQHGFPVN